MPEKWLAERVKNRGKDLNWRRDVSDGYAVTVIRPTNESVIEGTYWLQNNILLTVSHNPALSYRPEWLSGGGFEDTTWTQ